jgi:hypothetical protein
VNADERREKPKDPRNERLIVRLAFRCPECGQTWTTDDDPQEWAYGHDCEG